MALAFTGRANDPDTTNTTAYATPAFTPTADADIYVGIVSSGNGATAPTPTLDSPDWLSGGWTEEGVIEHSSGSIHMKMTVYSGRVGSSPGSDTLTATHSAAVSGCIIQVVEVTGADTTDDTIQVKTAEASGAGDFTITLDGAMGAAENATLAFFAHDIQEAHSPLDGETQIYGSSSHTHGSPNRAMSVQYKLNDVSSGIDWDNIAGSGVAVALEIKAASGATALSPGGIARNRSLGTPVVSATVVPASIVRVRALGDPSVGSATLLSPASIERVRVLGTPVANPTVAPAGIARVRTLGSPTVDDGSGVLVARLVSSPFLMLLRMMGKRPFR